LIAVLDFEGYGASLHLGGDVDLFVLFAPPIADPDADIDPIRQKEMRPITWVGRDLVLVLGCAGGRGPMAVYILYFAVLSVLTRVAGIDAQPDRAGGVSVMVGWSPSGYSMVTFWIL